MSTLLAASTGGHLSQLWRLWPRLVAGGADSDCVWLTFDTPQSRSLLKGQNVEWLPYIAPRDVKAALKGAIKVDEIVRRHQPHELFSTGSAIAVAAFPVARARGIACYYIESAARALGPSLSGRFVSWLPGVKSFAQYEGWPGPRWRFGGSIFDEFEPRSVDTATEVRRILVTLGTIPYPFGALIDAVERVRPPGVDVIWQLGHSRGPVSGEAVDFVLLDDMRAMVRRADVVVTHAGIGSTLMSLQEGKVPVLIPRSRARGEHVDDHQVQIADSLAARGLAIDATPDSLTWEDVVGATETRVHQAPSQHPFLFR